MELGICEICGQEKMIYTQGAVLGYHGLCDSCDSKMEDTENIAIGLPQPKHFQAIFTDKAKKAELYYYHD